MMSVAVSHFLSFDSLLHLAAACLAALSSEEQRRNLTMARLTKALAIASRPSTMPSAMAKLQRLLTSAVAKLPRRKTLGMRKKLLA